MSAEDTIPSMIDLKTETILTLCQATKYLPRRRGRRVSPDTVARWTREGHKGVKLESLETPSGRITTVEAIERFYVALTRQAGVPVESRRKVDLDAWADAYLKSRKAKRCVTRFSSTVSSANPSPIPDSTPR